MIFLLQVSVLGCPDPVVHEIAYQYGKNVGIAFQVGPLLFKNMAHWHRGKGSDDAGVAVLLTFLFSVHKLIDDVLDFTSCSDQMGKPTSADLKLGLATGPVLFACQQVRFPNLL